MNKFWRDMIYYLSLITGLGIAMATNVIVGFFLGSLVDNLTGSDLVFTAIGCGLGAIAGFWMMYKLTMARIDKK